MRVSLVATMALMFTACVFSVAAEPRHGVPADRREAFLDRRMSGMMVGDFNSFGSLLFAVDNVVIHTDDPEIGQRRLFSPFPDTYRPTRRELFDAMARSTESTWTYDDKRGYWLFSAPAKPQAYRLELANGWTAREPKSGDIAYQSPRGQQIGMNVSHIGRYSVPKKHLKSAEDTNQFWSQLRIDLALKYTKRFPGDISKEDLIATKIDDYEALYCVINPGKKGEYIWHQWVWIADGQGLLITCGTDSKYGTEIPADIAKMIESIKVTVD